jgi:hypothetical protein
VREHTREEARHIAWAQEMIKGLGDRVPETMDNIRQFTPVFVRQFVDAGVTNVQCFERMQFKDPAFHNMEELLEAVLTNEHRVRLNRELLRPVMDFFVEAGIYQPAYESLWHDAGFSDDIRASLSRVA